MLKVVINEQHSIMPDQVRALRERIGCPRTDRKCVGGAFDGEDGWGIDCPCASPSHCQLGFELVKIPADGLSASAQKHLAADLTKDVVVFASPVPVFMVELTRRQVVLGGPGPSVFHNDRREKKELPGGKLIMTVAQEGWVII